MDFKIGDKVKWTSKSSGTLKEKCGVILKIINSGEAAYPYIKEYVYSSKKGKRYSASRLGGGDARNHESYLIGVGNYLYWPRVFYLKKVG